MMTYKQQELTSKIIKTCADNWQISVFDIKSKDRRADIVEARDLAIMLIKKQTNMTNQAIAVLFGKKVSSIGYSLRRSLRLPNH